jgi:alkylation response protein AidB-like acyl-CoA dehydrogenase
MRSCPALFQGKRHQFGKPHLGLPDHPELSGRYVHPGGCGPAALAIQGLRGLKDAGRPFSSESAKAKLYCSQTAREVCNLAVQIHGGYGYSKEYEVERFFQRDAKVTEIYEGTSEVQRLVIARAILAEPS